MRAFLCFDLRPTGDEPTGTFNDIKARLQTVRLAQRKPAGLTVELRHFFANLPPLGASAAPLLRATKQGENGHG
jgi:hypothetical protein